MTPQIATAIGNHTFSTPWTPDQVEAAISALAAHPRVASVERAEDDPWGRPQVRIVATDTARGDLDRVLHLWKALNAMRSTRAEAIAEHEAFERREAQRLAASREEAAYRALSSEQKEAMRREGAARLRELGIEPRSLVRVCNGLARGSYLPDADLEAWATYVREVVRGRNRPMDLGRYVAGCVTA
ncbi:hypothetical protein Mpop_0197 [Methylorubrum populi BJ001]|uniref:Uncharacterized protein n=1 Tax=Methylorubrum populi (strain ATCC BAA-705 / NCIMB 13946 / BJ001) TaxID=441620 RepID=B1ZG53_METPB|nr:hypothetical protein [Methylorubrum populi]ACB78385.1 hypothetical protein Mpop_0197 [Methylorubrum populi BJ001]OAH28068.1 hypothetical protein AX289_24205 [Methylorubrum populi]PZP67827.1 MAG: hypothetical protein DI590_19290 [Methylorubrum populi]